MCFGYPNGGSEVQQAGMSLYNGPDHIQCRLKNRYFLFHPNQYYHDVTIVQERIQDLPEESSEYPGLKVVDVESDQQENTVIAPAQFEVITDEADESVTRSGVTLQTEPCDSREELNAIVNKLTGGAFGNMDGNAGVAVTDWDRLNGQPIRELKTPGFFSMAFPTVFINGSCDITHPSLMKPELSEWINHIYFTGDNRVSSHPFLKFFLYNLNIRQQNLKQGSYLVTQQLDEAHLTVSELIERIEAEDNSIPRKIIRANGNIVNTDPYWALRRQELDGFTFFRRKEEGDLGAYFKTNSLAELHWTPLVKLLAKYLSTTNGENYEEIFQRLNENSSECRKAVLQNLHIVTQYFDARSKNYYHTVCKELYQTDDFFYRYEFARHRGQIHTHGLLFSKLHAGMVEEALNYESENIGDPQKAEQLHEWLQTPNKNVENKLYSPIFTSMHPAGGHEVTDEYGDRIWIPDKTKWAKPDGTQDPPDYNPLKQKVTERCNTEQDLQDFHTVMCNRVSLHECCSYCLRRKSKESQTRYCKCHYGTEDPTTKKTPGKDLHPFEAKVVTSGHPRYEGPRDHPRHLLHTRTHLLTWLANCDTTPLVDQDLLNLQKYIVSYACKGAHSTAELCSIYNDIVMSSDPATSVKSIVFRMMNQISKLIDVSGACVDFINTGGKLYHNSRTMFKVGLSGCRRLNDRAADEEGNVTRDSLLDQFLSDERRKENPEQTLWDWAKECRCKTKCLKDHVPIFTGGPVKPVWPMSEDCCQLNLMIFSKGTWRTLEDLKGDHPSFLHAFSEFLQDPECPDALKEIVSLSRKRYEKTQEAQERRRLRRQKPNEDAHSQESQESSQQSINSQDSFQQNLNLGQALLRDASEQERSNAIEGEDPPLFNGGPDFDWHQYAIETFGQWDEQTKNWLKNKNREVEQFSLRQADARNPPPINLLLANKLQRVIIAMNILKLLEVKEKGLANVTPLHLIIQGTAGCGKTFVIVAISNIVRRLFHRNAAVLNLAPTGSASNLLPSGRTVHSVLPPSRSEGKSVQLSDVPFPAKSLDTFRKMIAFQDGDHQLFCVNMDERSMYSKELLAWSSNRLAEATGEIEKPFGNVPIINFFGDLGQLGPVNKLDLHTQPAKDDSPAKLFGFLVYRGFQECIVLKETMRQKPDQKKLLDRLLRIRNGTVTQQDWLDINARYEKELPQREQELFDHDDVLTLHETWKEVNEQNLLRLSHFKTPVATIRSSGYGPCHQKKFDQQVGQIPKTSYLAVGAKIILTKNQGAFTPYGLNNGSTGTVVSILYEPNVSPPSMPTAVICDFTSYQGPAFDPAHPTWVPIVQDIGRCDSDCRCLRKGLPLMPGYSVPIAKSQGMTVGQGKSSTHMRVKLCNEKHHMEQRALGTSYTAFSRVETESRWCLVEPVSQDRLLYINRHPRMVGRREEEKRLEALSQDTLNKYEKYSDPAMYIELLRRVDEQSDDGVISTECPQPTETCSCICCKSNTA